MLTPSESAEPGLWRNERTPYLAGIMDAACDPVVQEITFLKPTQVGGSEAERNILGYWIEEDPGPCLWVMPSENAVKEMIEERLKPLIFNSPSLRRHWSGDPHDITHSGIKLDTMPIYFGWAGSPQSLASRPCRYVVFDEVDKFPPFAGREADPISLGLERTATYGHRRKIVKISTPTTRNGPIYRSWENSGDRRHYHVPCPHCGDFQELIWQRVKWPKIDADAGKRADAIEQGRLAWYECGKCKQKILDHHKPKMLQAGRWVRDEGCDVSKRVAFHLDAIYSPWRSFSTEAAEDIRAGSDPGARMNVTNSRRAQPFDNLVSKTQSSIFREKSERGPERGVVPGWAVAVYATADTQKDWFKVHIRAWGAGMKSSLLLETTVTTFDEVYALAFESNYEIEGGGETPCHYLLIDSGGDRTQAVYQFAARDPGRIIPCKGASHTMRRPWTFTTLSGGVTLRMLDTNYYKDTLNRLVYDSDDTRWMVHKDVSEEFCIEMASEHKIIERGKNVERWVKKTSGARVESLDCEVLQVAAADMANLGVTALPTLSRPKVESVQVPQRPTSSFARSHLGRY